MTDMNNEDLGVIVLAAGLGKRMKSNLAKVLHPLCGRPMLSYALDLAKAIDPAKIVVVAGQQESKVREMFGNEPIEFTRQDEQLGTGHAVLVAREQLKDLDGALLILSGDVPLLRAETLENFTSYHRAEEAEVTILTAVLEDPTSYGRIIRKGGEVFGIVEEGDASEEERSIREINTGIYVFSSRSLWGALVEIQPDNAQGEYYLTDAIQIIREEGGSVRGYAVSDPEETMGINTRESLAEARKVLQMRIHRKHMLSGVTIIDPMTTEIDWAVKVGRDTVIHPFTSLKGKTEIEEQCEVGPHAVIVDSRIGRGAKVSCFARLEKCELPPAN